MVYGLVRLEQLHVSEGGRGVCTSERASEPSDSDVESG